MQSVRQADLTRLLEQIVWLHSELGLQIPDPDDTEDLCLIVAEEQQKSVESTTRAQASSSACTTTLRHNRTLTEFAARVAELDEERFESFVFDDIDPTQDVILYFEAVLQEVGLQVLRDHTHTLRCGHH